MSGTVVDGPPPSGVKVTDGGPLGAAGAVAGACLVGAGCGVWRSRTVEPVPEPREAIIASESEVSMNSAAATVVALDKMVAVPRGPKVVCDPMPPKAPARSAALPLCSSTTTTRKKQTRM